MVKESKEPYIVTSYDKEEIKKPINNKHDKTLRMILTNKQDVAYIINKALNLKGKMKIAKEELETYKNNNKVYCQNGGRGLQIWMQEDGLKATFCPILAEVSEKYIFDLVKGFPILMDGEKNKCAVCGRCLDDKVKEMSVHKKGREFLLKNEMFYNVCRYYSDKRRYG